MKRSYLILLPCTILLLAGAAPASFAEGEIPARPEQLTYNSLDFEVPGVDNYRHELSNGIPVYVAQDRDLPLVTVSITLRAGNFVEPDGKLGVAEMAGTMLRRGGTASRNAEEFDERAAFLAANISSFTGDTSSGASVNCITPVFGEALELFFEMLKSPAFQQDRLDVEKNNLLERMKQRNDRPQSISGREWRWLMRGEDHFSARMMTQANVAALAREDLVDYYKNYWRPENMMVAVSGDVETSEVLAQLEKHFQGWDVKGPTVPWPPVPPTHTPNPGVYHVEKDIPQGRVLIGHLTYQRKSWKDKEESPLRILNDILGGGGFTSRLVKRIRSDEGLAYSAGSGFNLGLYWPGTFSVRYQSKSPTVALAAKIAMEEIDRIRTSKVSEEELAVAKGSFIEVFPRRFESAADIVNTFVNDEYAGRPAEYWINYRDRIQAVTADQVLKAAKKHLDPEKLVFLIVGKWDEIAPGDPDKRASMKEFFGGKATELPLRDPLTLEPMK